MVNGCARAAAIVLVAGLASCDDGRTSAQGGIPPRTAAGRPGAAGQRGAAPPRVPSSPAGAPTVTYHDVMLMHSGGRENPKIQMWAITLLVNKAPELTREKVKEAVGAVLGPDVAAKVSDGGKFAALQKFEVGTDAYFLSVDAARGPYCELWAIDFMPIIIGDVTALRAFGKHNSFVSVSVMAKDPTTRAEMYANLGKIAAHFLDSTVVCVHCRDGDVYLEAGDDVARVLRGEDPQGVLEFFQDRRLTLVKRGDPAMQAGMDEARRRLPEFLEVWRAHEGKGAFTVKARFETCGVGEYMWIVLKSVDGESMSGELASRPRLAKDLHEGQMVTVPMSAVMDWAYGVPGKGDGPFTDPIVGPMGGKGA